MTKRRLIPLNRPKIGFRERLAVDRVLRSGLLAQGPLVEEFEQNFGQIIGARHCIAVNSGTSALHLGMLALGIGPGDEVIVPAFTFAASANSVALCGARVVFADVNPKTYCIDPLELDKLVTAKTRAVMAVHLFGSPADLRALKDFCVKRGILLIEDAAQAHLASVDHQPVGTWGDLAAFSFYPTKNMTTGEGGMVVTASTEVDATVRLLRNQGMRVRYQNELVGFNNRMTEISAAIGLQQLRKLNSWTDERIFNADFYLSKLEGVQLPVVEDGHKHVFHQFTIGVPAKLRDRFRMELHDLGIASDVYYPTTVQSLPSFQDSAVTPNAMVASQSVISIPVHQNLKRRDLIKVATSVNKVAESISKAKVSQA